MGQVLHGSATTTHTIRTAIQRSKAPLKDLTVQYGLNQKPVAKWRKRSFVHDAPMGPVPRSTIRDRGGGGGGCVPAAYVAALDDCLYALQFTIPHLTRSSLHRCLQRHGIGRLANVEGDRPARKKFKSYPIGFFHIDIAEVRTEQGKLHMFAAIDRTSKLAYVELHERATTAVSREFLLRLIAAVPYKIHTVLTDNGIQFTTPGAGGSAVPLINEAMANGELFWANAFELTCARNDIDHRTTKAKHPRTNGQVERTNRTIKDATVRRFY